MAAKKDLLVYQGDDHTWFLRLRHADLTDPLNPVYTPVDLTAYTLLSHIRQDYADVDTTVDAAFEFQITDAAAGEVNMFLSSEQTALMRGRYRWDLQMARITDDYITTLLYGIIRVRSEVTRP